MILDLFFQKQKKHSTQQNERTIRSVAKAVSWRFVGTLDTLLISFIITGELRASSVIASVDFFTKLVLYFFHERFWNMIKWGKNT